MSDPLTLLFSSDSFIPDPDDDGGVSYMDTPPDPHPQPSASEWVCFKCGRDVPPRRGRKPRPENILCEDHRGSTTGAVGKGSSGVKRLSKEAKDEHRLKKISGDLQEGLGQVTGVIVPFMPVTGATMAIQGPRACEAVVQAATPFPRFLDGLEKAAMALPWITIAQFVMAIMLASAVDMGRLEPYGLAAEMLRVSEAAERAGWQRREPQPAPGVVHQEARQQQSTKVSGFVAPQPPRFDLRV